MTQAVCYLGVWERAGKRTKRLGNLFVYFGEKWEYLRSERKASKGDLFELEYLGVEWFIWSDLRLDMWFYTVVLTV